MPKFLAGCHYNEEEISRHLNKNIGYWSVQMNGNKFATGEILGKPVEVVKRRILAGWAQKSSEPYDGVLIGNRCLYYNNTITSDHTTPLKLSQFLMKSTMHGHSGNLSGLQLRV